VKTHISAGGTQGVQPDRAIAKPIVGIRCEIVLLVEMGRGGRAGTGAIIRQGGQKSSSNAASIAGKSPLFPVTIIGDDRGYADRQCPSPTSA
jgi:hypothetical protein